MTHISHRVFILVSMLVTSPFTRLVLTRRTNTLLRKPLTNHQKGRVGETTVIKTLIEQCPDWEVHNTSRNPSESDVNLVNACGELVAFECKYKRIITSQDTEKSIRDIRHLKDIHGNKLIGYMFISLRSVNIPHRSFYESIEGIPTLWVGLDETCAQYMLPLSEP